MEYDPAEIRTVLGPNVVPAVGQAVHSLKPPRRAGAFVAGLALGEEARAYPLNVLAFHQVVNDSVGGIPVAVTYDPLCSSAIAFVRRAEGSTLNLRVSGKILRNNLLMYDEGTRSLWSQMRGRAVEGPLVGKTMETLALEVVKWSIWSADHPGTLFLEPPNPLIDYGGDVDPAYVASPTTLFPRKYRDDRMHPKEMVAGLRIGSEARAYPLAALPKSGLVLDRVAGVDVAILEDDGAVRAWEVPGPVKRDGKRIVGTEAEWDNVLGRGKGGNLRCMPLVVSHWFAWVDFYPDTLVWQP